jgi:hypothetical protein
MTSAGARGFTLPLTTALAFSLMSLAGGVVGLVVVTAGQARSSERDVAVLVSLESAIQSGLFTLQRDGAPIANSWTDEARFNGEQVQLLFAPTKYKPDIDRDAPADQLAVLVDTELKAAVSQAEPPPIVPPTAPATGSAMAAVPRMQFQHFTDLVRAAGVDTAGEDCLRQRLTLGRGSAQPATRLPETALIPDRAPLVAGDLIDVRAALADSRRGHEILWMRVRYSGQTARPWRVHDWRRLHLGPSAPDCPLPPPQSLLP